MTPSILGTGWVTPLGREIASTWEAYRQGQHAEPVMIDGDNSWPILRVPPDTLKDVNAIPRLRRSSTISLLAVAAAKDAVAMAGLTTEQLARTALLFAASDGGVIYTRRFHLDIIKSGMGSGSPLLFPETVYNAPASHVAAALGLNDEVLTLVGDASAGLDALHTATELMTGSDVEHCLVVAAQELDWISAEAYGRWHLIGGTGSTGAYFAEGAAAVVIGREGGGSQLAALHPGHSFSTNAEAGRRMISIFRSLPAEPDTIITTGAGIQFDEIEAKACAEVFPSARILEPKRVLGDALAASTLENVIIGDLLLREGSIARVLIPAAGYNGQLGALLLTQGQK